MMDVAESRGYHINIARLSTLIGAPVVPLVAARNEGTQELLAAVIDVVEGNARADGMSLQYGHDIEEEIAKLEKVIAEKLPAGDYLPRWLAVKLLEEDEEIIERIRQAHVVW